MHDVSTTAPAASRAVASRIVPAGAIVALRDLLWAGLLWVVVLASAHVGLIDLGQHALMVGLPIVLLVREG